MSETTNPAQAEERGPETPAPADEQAHATQEQSEPQAEAAQTEPAGEEARRYLEMAQRTQADFENYKRRASRELTAARQRGAAELARELLPALDNLDRAIDAADQDDPLLQGVRLVREELAGALSRAGIESYSPAGEQFDPTLHEAVATAPSPGGEGGGTVIEVYQAGYRLGDTVIRPARVVVGA